MRRLMRDGRGSCGTAPCDGNAPGDCPTGESGSEPHAGDQHRPPSTIRRKTHAPHHRTVYELCRRNQALHILRLLCGESQHRTPLVLVSARQSPL